MPRINRITADARPVGPRPDPEAYGAAEGRAMVRVGKAVKGVAETFDQLTEGYYRTDTAYRAQEGDRRLRELAQAAQLKKFDEREKWFKEQSEEVYSDISEGVTPGRSGQLRYMLDESRNRYETHVRGTIYRDASNGAKLNLSHTLNMLAEDAAGEPSELAMMGYLQRGDSAIENYAADFGVSDAEARDIRINFARRVADLRGPAMREHQATGLAMEILTTTDDTGEPLTKEARLELVGQIGDDDLRADVKRRVEVTTDREEAQRLRALEMKRETAWTAVMNGGGLEAIPGDLPADDQRQMRTYVRTTAAKQAKGQSTQIVTDAKRWNELWDMAENQPDKFASLNLWKDRRNLENTDFNGLKAAQKSLKDGDGGYEPPLSSSDRTFLNDLASAAGITDSETKATLRLQYKRAAESQRETRGRELSIDEKESTAQEIIRGINVPGRFGIELFGETVRVGEMNAEQVQAVLEDPPGHLIESAIKAYAKRGVENPTNDQINTVIRQYMKNLGAIGVE